MKTGLTKKQKTTELYYNAKDTMAEIYTHDTKLKRRLAEYAAKFPALCQLTEDDEQDGLRFEISKSGAYALLNCSDFPTLRIGGRKMVMKKELLEWLNSRTNRPR